MINWEAATTLGKQWWVLNNLPPLEIMDIIVYYGDGDQYDDQWWLDIGKRVSNKNQKHQPQKVDMAPKVIVFSEVMGGF